MDEHANKLIKAALKLPAYPHSVHRALQLAADINCRPRDLARVIQFDPIMTAHLLRMLNAKPLGLPDKVVSINQAIVQAGFNTVKHLALSITSFGTLPRQKRAGTDMMDLLLHAVCTAVIAKALAEHLELPSEAQERCFQEGLLHDLGKLILAQFRPGAFGSVVAHAKKSGIDLYKAEELEFGFNHAQLGAEAAKQWGLPPAIILAMEYHHHPEKSKTESDEQAIRLDCLHVANALARDLGFGNAETHADNAINPDALARFNLKRDDLIKAITSQPDHPEKSVLVRMERVRESFTL